MFERTYGGLVEASSPVYRFVGEVNLMQDFFRMQTASVVVYAKNTEEAEQKVQDMALFHNILHNQHLKFKWTEADEVFGC